MTHENIESQSRIRVTDSLKNPLLPDAYKKQEP